MCFENVETKQARTGISVRACAFCVILHRLVDDGANGVRRLPAHPLGGVGVGVQGEACGVMPQGVG